MTSFLTGSFRFVSLGIIKKREKRLQLISCSFWIRETFLLTSSVNLAKRLFLGEQHQQEQIIEHSKVYFWIIPF